MQKLKQHDLDLDEELDFEPQQLEHRTIFYVGTDTSWVDQFPQLQEKYVLKHITHEGLNVSQLLQEIRQTITSQIIFECRIIQGLEDLEQIKMIRNNHSFVPILVLGENESTDYIQMAYKFGANDFFSLSRTGEQLPQKIDVYDNFMKKIEIIGIQNEAISAKFNQIQKAHTDLKNLNHLLEGEIDSRKILELELIQHRDNLQVLVDERTASLNNKTQQLETSNQQISQQNTVLQISNDKLKDLIGTKDKLLQKLGTLTEVSLTPLEDNISRLKQELANKPSENLRQIERIIHQVASVLEPVTRLYASEQAIKSKRVLLAENIHKFQMISKMALGGTGVELEIVSSIEEGLKILETQAFDIVCTNAELLPVAKAASEKYPNTKVVFMTAAASADNVRHLKANTFLSNIVSRNEEDRTFTIKNITSTVVKLMTHDIFSLEKYLSWGVDVREFIITDSDMRRDLLINFETYLKTLGIRRGISQKSVMAAEELLMNAVYDAPVDANGVAKYNHLDRTVRIDLEPNEQGKFRYACDGILLAVSVEDPFGAFKRSTILDYLESCYEGRFGSINRDRGKCGAGLGLFQMVESAELIVFNIKEQVRTEVIVIFNIQKEARKTSVASFHYFSDQNE